MEVLIVGNIDEMAGIALFDIFFIGKARDYDMHKNIFIISYQENTVLCYRIISFMTTKTNSRKYSKVGSLVLQSLLQ